MFQTRVTQMLGIQYPIIEGGMMWLGRGELAAAVSNAGGLGMIAAGNFPSPGELREEMKKVRGLTDKPFGVNVSVTPTFRPVDRGVLIDTAVQEGAAAIETAGKDALQYASRIKKGKTRWTHKCARVRDALKAEGAGADMVTVVGYECGGAPPQNEITTFILVPLAADALGIPVLAGGGIGDARGFLAALTLGAEGVVMGTRFIATKECTAHPNIKEALLKARESDTVLVQRSIGTMERVLRNQTAETVLAMEKRGASLEELKEFIIGERAQKSWFGGDVEYGVLPCGQVIGQIRDIVSVQEFIQRLVEGARAIHQRLSPDRSSREVG